MEKTIKIELTERELVGLFFAVNQGQFHYSRYPYVKDGDEQYEKEMNCIYDGLRVVSAAMLEQYPSGTAKVVKKYFPEFGKILEKAEK